MLAPYHAQGELNGHVTLKRHTQIYIDKPGNTLIINTFSHIIHVMLTSMFGKIV